MLMAGVHHGVFKCPWTGWRTLRELLYLLEPSRFTCLFKLASHIHLPLSAGHALLGGFLLYPDSILSGPDA